MGLRVPMPNLESRMLRLWRRLGQQQGKEAGYLVLDNCCTNHCRLWACKASRALAAGAGAGAVGLALCVPPARADGASADVPAFTMEAPKYDQLHG